MHNTSCARRARYTFYEDELRTYLGELEARLAEQEGRLELALRRVLDGSGRIDPPQESLDGLHPTTLRVPLSCTSIVRS